MQKQLNGETIRVNSVCIVGFTGEIEYSVAKVGGLKSMFFGGEGLFLASLSGAGTIWLQSLPFSRLADRVLAHAPSNRGKPNVRKLSFWCLRKGAQRGQLINNEMGIGQESLSSCAFLQIWKESITLS